MFNALTAKLKAELQAFFDTAYRAHVIERQPLGAGRENTHGWIVCSYAKGCAVGVNLYPHEMRRVITEDLDSGDVYVLFRNLRPASFGEEHLPFLRDLQAAHDGAATKQGIFVDIVHGSPHRVARDYDHSYESVRKGQWYHARRNYRVVAKAWGLTIPS
jgi:hypothetical protein